MKVGMIGLGQIGEVMSRRLISAGHQVHIYHDNITKADDQYEKGYISGYTTSIQSLVQVVRQKELYGKKSGETVYVKAPGIFIMVVPTEIVEDTLDELLRLCCEGDIVINYGNSSVEDCWKREERCAKLGIAYLDCDINNDTCDVGSGYNFMVRGGNTAIATCKGIFHTLGRWEYTTKHSSVI